MDRTARALSKSSVDMFDRTLSSLPFVDNTANLEDRLDRPRRRPLDRTCELLILDLFDSRLDGEEGVGLHDKSLSVLISSLGGRRHRFPSSVFCLVLFGSTLLCSLHRTSLSVLRLRFEGELSRTSSGTRSRFVTICDGSFVTD
mmetsp:Transcript_19623/g.43715  ORF Transcript_19623/g.43715 Transcript_19623/m.43715 type:complete len:144 (-) Transcript_19623:387-818(-)